MITWVTTNGHIAGESLILEKIEAYWGKSQRDLVYLAVNGLLKASIWLYGVRIENLSLLFVCPPICFLTTQEKISDGFRSFFTNLNLPSFYTLPDIGSLYFCPIVTRV